MALISDNEVQLRISTKAEGQGEVDGLSNSISDLEKDFLAVGQAARDASAKQAEAGQKLQAAKAAQDALRDALAAAKNEYQTLSASAKQSGTSQADFAAQSATAKQRIADLKTELLTASGNVRKLNTEYSGASNETKRLAAEHQRLATSMTVAGKEAVDMTAQVKGISNSISELKVLYAAWIGVQQGANMLSGVAATADAYTNLQAKLKLVVGDGEALASAFKGVQEVALSTNSSLESTGTLFSKIADIGKRMGVSNEEALRLTETINQSIQLSGASAQASDAAITQLVQGLQGGVLRGDEFNSIMEQSPRLAKALADGLGVTTGELRKLAEAGQLTAETVIGALKGQAQAIEGEFSQLPATIGRAITTLETQWKLWIGTMDESTGASATVAAAIEGLANNFDLVASSLMNAGQAYLGWKAYNIAAEFLSLKVAVGASTVAKTADTVATVANTVATGANTAAQIANNAAKSGAAVAADAAAAGAGRLASALSLIKGLSLAFLVTNLVDIGKWLGEAAAKAMGHGKALQDAEIKARALESATKAMIAENAALAQKFKLAAEAALGLDANSKRIVASFDDLRLKGDTVAEALSKISKELDLSNIDGINQAGAALDALAVKGKISADEVRTAWAAALDGKDLQVFEANALAAFDGSEQGARRLAAAMDAQLAEAIRRTGKDFGELSNGVNAAAQKAINDFDVLAGRLDDLGKKGVDVGVTLAASLDQAVKASTTTAALEEIIRRFKELGDAGLLAGDKMVAGIEKAQRKLEDLKPGINSVEEAFRQLGMKSPQELQKVADSSKQAFDEIKKGTEKTESGLKLIGQAFIKYAENALQANGGVVTDAMRVEAAMAGVEIKVDGAGKAMFVYRDAANASADGSNNAAGAAERSASAYDKVAEAAARAAAEKEKLAKLEDEARNAQRAPVEMDVEQILLSNGATIEEAKQGAQYFNPLMTQRNAKGQGVGDPEGQARAVAAEAIARAKKDLMTDEEKANTPGTTEFDKKISELMSRTPAQREPAKTPFMTPAENAKTVNVNINLDGRKTNVKVASQDDANALTNFLRQIESDARRAN
jgi:tape measure domain-containing protein